MILANDTGTLPAEGNEVPRPAPLPVRCQPEPEVIQASLGHAAITETMDTVMFSDAGYLGRGAIDTIFAVALAERGRNQEAR
jgi:hypothetical protein